jgi:hypothetical protein
MSRIRGMFPGGPRHGGGTSEPRGTLRAGEHLEAEITDHALDESARRKRRSKLIAVVGIGILAVTGGIYVGMQALVTPEQLTVEQRTEGRAGELEDLTRSVLDELWRMENVEAARNRR